MEKNVKNIGNSTKDFLKSNSLISKVAFILLVVFVFVIILRLAISLMSSIYTRGSRVTKFFDGMVDGKQLLVYPQDPNTEGSKTINRSVNATDGIEFSWSVWLMIDTLTYNSGKFKCVFYKGNDDIQDTGLNFPNNAPGLYINPETNAMSVIMNTFNVINQIIEIPDVPLNKWFNIIIRCENTTLDVYVNGTIVKSQKLNGVPKQNYGNVYVGMNGGFDGNISNLWYYEYALGIAEIQRIMKKGPNTKLLGSSFSSKMPNYLSMRWYFYGENDEYNP
jgi:hypothetical protein